MLTKTTRTEIKQYTNTDWEVLTGKVPILYRKGTKTTNASRWLREYKKKKPSRYTSLSYVLANTQYVGLLRYASSSVLYQARLSGYKNYYRTNAWKAVKQLVFARDNHCCRICGNDQLSEAHHVRYLWFGAEEAYLWTVSTLCKRCHLLFHRLYRYDPRLDCYARGKRK